MQSLQERVLSKRPAIVAATPGRLWDLMQVRRSHFGLLANLEPTGHELNAASEYACCALSPLLHLLWLCNREDGAHRLQSQGPASHDCDQHAPLFGRKCAACLQSERCYVSGTLAGAQCHLNATHNATSQDGGGASKHLTQLQRLDFLVLDEADRMVQQGHYQVRRRTPCSDEARYYTSIQYSGPAQQGTGSAPRMWWPICCRTSQPVPICSLDMLHCLPPVMCSVLTS